MIFQFQRSPFNKRIVSDEVLCCLPQINQYLKRIHQFLYILFAQQKRQKMIKEKIPELDKLTREEKRVLAGELWDEVMSVENIELTSNQKKVLDERIEYAKTHPEEVISWDSAKKVLLKKYNV